MYFNHPLAGMVMHFDGKVEGVRDATQEELDHGHVHGEGGHNH
jgi:FKBP-type peptidyl-prolyl cis-trans isomerase SlyD